MNAIKPVTMSNLPLVLIIYNSCEQENFIGLFLIGMIYC